MLGTIVPQAVSPLALLAGGVVVAALVGLLGRLLPSPKPFAVAHLADARLGLGERLSTALDLAAGRIPATALAGRVMADAAERARGVELGQAFRVRPPAFARWAALLMGVALLAGVVIPGLTLPATPARQTAMRIQREGRRLEQVARRLEQTARTERAPQARRMAPEVRSLGRQLQRERLQRAAALARLAALERQVEATRRQLSERIGEALAPRASPALPESLFRPSRDLDRPIRQLRELAARLAQEQALQGERQDLLQQLSELSGTGEGQLPISARQKVEEARRQVEAGNTAAGSERLTEALEELEGLRTMIADEQALKQTRQELERSASRIARAPGGRGRTEEDPQGEGPPAPLAAGSKRLPEQDGEALGAPPRGPHEGSAPGEGRTAEKLGPPSPRLGAAGDRSRIRGQEARGGLHTSEILGPGRQQAARTPEVNLSPTVRRQADEYMARARIPTRLRGVVRRYFEILAQRR
jgi:hypothetical protein